MAPPAPGFPQPFGKYRLLRKLARGGMAELFLATPGESRRPVVIKRVLPHFTPDTEFLKMFLNEARIAALLNHPGIVRVFDLGNEEDHLFLAMEYVDGFDLETLTRLAGGRLPPLIAARVAADVCDALYFANRVTDLEGKPLNVVHRDVTPGNVMITRRGQVKLVDFGVAKAAAQLERTRPGVVKGKFRYMSPEQISFKELDGRSDLFSLGVLLYEVTTGEKPFERKQIIDIIRALTEWNPPPPTEVVKGYPKALSAVILKALEKDRDQRYRNAREMGTALEGALARTPTGKAELAAFLAELQRAHPKEMASAATGFDLDLSEDAPADATEPARPAPPERPSRTNNPARASGRLQREEVPRTEAIPSDRVKKMIDEADRRHAQRPSVRLSKPPPPVAEPAPSPLLGADDDHDEETTTDAVLRRPRPAPEAAPDDLDDGPSTLKVRTTGGPPSRRFAPPPPDPAPFGDDDDLDAPTISNVQNRPDRVPLEPEAEAEPEPSVASSVTEARQRAGRSLLVVAVVLLCAAAAVLGWLLLEARRPADVPPQLQDGVNLGQQPLEDEEEPPARPPRRGAAAPGPDASAPAPEVEVQVIGGEEGGEEPAAPESEPAAGEGTGTLVVEGRGVKVSVASESGREPPFTVENLKAGSYKCSYVPARGSGRRRTCRTAKIEAGQTFTLRVP